MCNGEWFVIFALIQFLVNLKNYNNQSFCIKRFKKILRFENNLKTMSIHEYNGGTLVGMVGKDCVGIACDRRFGKQLLTITNDFQRVFKYQDNLIMGLGGLGTDIQTFSALM
jgi:20S proteasome alpha/beta subunit